MGDIALAPRDIRHTLLFIEFNDALGQVEINGAMLVAVGVENQCQLFHVTKVMRQRGVSLAHFRVAFENLVYVGIGHALRRTDDAGSHARGLLAARDVKVHEHAHDQAIFAGLQRAHAIGKRFREHRYGTIGEIDGSAAQARLVVESAGGANVMRHVGDVHLEVPVSIGAALHINRIVEVARGFAIYRNDRQTAKVLASCALGITDGSGAMLRLLHDLSRKKMRKMVLADDNFGVDTKLAWAAQNLDDAAGRSGSRPRIARQLDIDNGSIE